MPALTSNFEFEYNNYQLCSGTETAKTLLIQAQVFESPEIRVTDKIRGSLDGMISGNDLYGSRKILLTLEVWGTTEAEFYNEYLGLLSALKKRSTEALLRFKLPQWPDLQVMCKPRRVSGPTIDQSYALFKGIMTIEFVASDPRIYADGESSGIASFTATTAGMTFNATFDLTFGGLTTSNTVLALNTGNYDAPWRAVITGPITNPGIESVALGKTLTFAGTVNTGETLVVRSQPDATVLLNGTASRYSWLTDANQWFLLAPGLNSIRLQGSSVGTPTMTFYWRSAWT